jgi:hypothetical protein
MAQCRSVLPDGSTSKGLAVRWLKLCLALSSSPMMISPSIGELRGITLDACKFIDAMGCRKELHSMLN